MNHSLYAVLTGDVIMSTKWEKERESLLEVLWSSLETVQGFLHGKMYGRFEIYRGDGFQGVLNDPLLALKAAIMTELS